MKYEDKTQHLTINFTSGKQKLNGQHVEEYVRFRHDNLGDIGRVQRQQEVVKAILRELLQPSTVSKIPKLLQVVKDNVDTDLSLGHMLGITQFIGHVDRQHMNLVMLPGRFSARNEYPRSYWIANYQAMTPILAKYFNVNANQNDASNQEKFPAETIKIALINGTKSQAKVNQAIGFLAKHGFSRAYMSHHDIDSDNFPVQTTKIIAQKGNLQAANAVKNALGVGEIEVDSTGDIESDITVIVGQDLGRKFSSLSH